MQANVGCYLELQSDLLLIAACAGLGGTWKRLCWELRLDTSSAGFGTL